MNAFFVGNTFTFLEKLYVFPLITKYKKESFTIQTDETEFV